jgi:hypothetical protein
MWNEHENLYETNNEINDNNNRSYTKFLYILLYFFGQVEIKLFIW